MKPETAALLQKYHSAKRFQFVDSDLGLELEYDLSDAEKLELVESEYGKKLTATVDDLFLAIMKKVIRLSLQKVKETK